MEFALRSCWCLDLGSGPQEAQVQAPGSGGQGMGRCSPMSSRPGGRASRETLGQSPLGEERLSLS